MSSSCCKIISKEIIKDIRFDTNLKIGEDSVFMAKSAKCQKHCTVGQQCYILQKTKSRVSKQSKAAYIKKCNIVCKLLKKYTKMLTPSYNIPFIATHSSRTSETSKKLTLDKCMTLFTIVSE